MKKKGRNYSVIIVSDATSSSKEFVLSSRFIKKAIVSFSILVIVFGFLIFDYLTTSFNRERLRRVEKDNVKKEKTIKLLNTTIKNIEKNLEIMSEFEKRIKVATGLTSPYALREVGTGGPITNIKSSEMSKVNLNVNKGQIKDNVIERAKKLNKESKRIVDSLKFVYEVKDKQNVRLASTPMVWPTKGYLSDPYGWRKHPMTGKREFHHGLDIATQLGNKVMATANGIVLVAEDRSYYGNLIIIDHGFDYMTWYGHLASFNVKEGQRVKRGQVIGYVGSTGRSNAPHLHYEVRFMTKTVNPLKFIID